MQNYAEGFLRLGQKSFWYWMVRIFMKNEFCLEDKSSDMAFSRDKIFFEKLKDLTYAIFFCK